MPSTPDAGGPGGEITDHDGETLACPGTINGQAPVLAS
jgi:hypothetical protein